MAKVEFDVVANINRALASLKTLEGTVAGSATKMEASLNLAKIAAAGLGAGFAAIITGKVINDLGEFSKSVAEVKSIAPDVIKNNEKLADSFIELGTTFGKSAQEEAKLLYQIISAGITDAAESQETLIASNKLAIGGLAGTEESVNILTTALNVYKDQNLSAEKAADILFTTVKLGKTNVSELASSLGTVLPIAKTFGLSFEEVNASIADLTAKGIPSTSQAVTALRGVLNGVIQAQSQLAGESKEVQKAFSINALKTKDFTTFLKDANDAVGGNEVKLKKLLGSIEGVTGFVTLASGGFKGLKNSLDEMSKSTGAADKAYKEISNTLGFQITKFKENFGNLILKFSSQGEGALTKTLELINTAVESVVLNFDYLVDRLKRIAIEVGAFLLVVKGIPITIKAVQVSMAAAQAGAISLGGAFNIAKTAIQGLGISIKTLKATLSFGILLVVDLLIEKILELSEKFGGFANLAQVAFSQVKIYFIQFVNSFLSGVNKIAGIFGKSFDFSKTIEINNRLIKESQNVIDDIRGKIEGVGDEIKKTGKKSRDAKGDLEDTFDPAPAKALLDKIKEENEKLGKEIAKIGKSQIETIKLTTSERLKDIDKQIAGLDLSKDVNKEIKKALEIQKQQILLQSEKNIGVLREKELLDELNDQRKKQKEEERKKDEAALIKSSTISQIEVGFGSGVASFFSAASDFLTPITAVSDSIKALSTGINKLTNFIPEILDSITSVFSTLNAFPQKLLDSFQNLFSSVIDFASSFLQNLITKLGVILVESFQFLFRDLPKALAKTFQELPDVLFTVISKLPDILIDILENFNIEKLVQSLAELTPRLAVAFIESMITNGGIIRLSIALAKALAIQLPVGIVKGILAALKNLGREAFSALGDYFSSRIKLPTLTIPEPPFLEKLRSNLSGGPLVELLQRIVDFLQNIANQIGKALGQGGGGVFGQLKSGNIGGAVNDLLGGDKRKGILGFAEGGIVPKGFPNDTFPARLTSGELVIDRSTVDKLNRFIDQGGSNQPIQINLKVGESDLAQVMYNLNRQGFRVA